MIIFLYGPDTFRSVQKLKEIIKSYKTKHKSGLNFRQFEQPAECFEELSDVLSSISMFSEKKLVIIKNGCSSSGIDQQRLLELVKSRQADEDNDLILVFWEDGGNSKNNKLFNWLVKKAKQKENFEF